MPRRKRIPSYCLHKSSGHARVFVNRQEIFLGEYNSPESFEKYQRLIAELTAGDPTPQAVRDPRGGLTVIEMLAAYLRHAEDYYRHSGELDNIKKALRPLRDLYGRTVVTEFGPPALKALRQTMIDAGLCRTQINKRVRSIIRVFRWAASEQLVPVAVADGLATVEGLRKGFTEARESEPVEPVSAGDVQATLPHLPPTVADMVRLQRLTGGRPTEICTMRYCDIDRRGEVWSYTPARHKTDRLGRQRVIFIGPQAQTVLRPYLLRDAESYCFSPRESEQRRLAARHAQRRTPVSCGNRPGTQPKRHPRRRPAERYSRDSYRLAVRRACIRARIVVWSPHQLRHSAATEIRQRFGLEAAQVTLGHASADVTQVYAERDLALARRVAAEVG